MTNIFMKAPRRTTSANIEGCTYDVPSDGIIQLVNPDHAAILKRHGFEMFTPEPDPEELFAQIDAMEDKTDLVNFIEERGGEADDSMSSKKLRRLAKALVTSEDSSAEDEE